MHQLVVKGGAKLPHIIDTRELSGLAYKSTRKRPPIKIGQWVFNMDWSWLGWQPLSAAVCQSGMIALYPVRKVDLSTKHDSVMHEIIGVKTMKPCDHYVLLSDTGLTGRNWEISAINKK